MQVRESDPSRVVLELSHNEVILLNNALDEVCNGLDLPDFSTRLGAGKDELEELLRQVRDALDGMIERKDEG